MANAADPNKNGTSVVSEPIFDATPVGSGSFVINYATVADGIHPWGTYPRLRDRQLREFWPTENLLASAIYSTCSKYIGIGWSLDGPSRTTRIYQEILQGVERGKGLSHMLNKVLIDYLTQDNSAFIEIVRVEDSPTSPMVTLNHLDSDRCFRTGKKDEPVVYQSEDGKLHRLKWYQVVSLEEFPSPVLQMRGMQYCAVTRILKTAQILRDAATYKSEKISGRFIRAIHLVGGVQQRQIQDAFTLNREHADNLGLTRYIQPLVVSALDPTSRVTHETIEMASLPDGFDEEVYMKWYITALALALGQDYQDFAPLPSGNLGTSQQSQILHLKSRGKGPAMFMTNLMHAFNFQGILPNTIKFKFGEQDVVQDIERANLRKARAEARAIMIKSQQITPEVARQMAFDDGDITEAQLKLMGESNYTPDVVVSSNDPAGTHVGEAIAEGAPIVKPTVPEPSGVQTTTSTNGPQKSPDKINV